jgi:hypothetical protein
MNNTIKQQIDKLEEIIKIQKELIQVYIELRDETKQTKPIESMRYAHWILNNQIALDFYIKDKENLETLLNNNNT